MMSITDEQVRLIFRDTYSLYKKNKDFELFKVIINLLPLADEKDVSGIMADAYNLFLKYKGIYLDEDWCNLCKEAKEINKKYKNNDFCRQVLIEILNILEERYKKKGNG